MNTYKIFSSPMGQREAVKVGWSWPAFFFLVFWALTKKMWALGGAVFIFGLVLGFVEFQIFSMLQKSMDISLGAYYFFGTAINLLVMIFFGLNGNHWREQNLISRGYDYKNSVVAANSEGAIATWMKNEEK